MTLLLIFIPTIFPVVSHIRIIRVFHERVKRPTIPEIESKKYALSNLRGIINTLCALEDNILKTVNLLVFHSLAQTQSSYAYRILKISSRLSGKVRRSVGLAYKRVFLIVLVFCDSSIQVVSWVLVHPILVDSIYHVVGVEEVDAR